MSWAEFRIRLHSYQRQELNNLYKLRELAWVTYIAPHLNPKKLKRTKDAFWSIKNKAKGDVTDLMKERIKDAQKKYFDELKEK